jgi:hypothetical protein
VELTTQKADLRDPDADIHEFLYDGQTGELLASYSMQGKTCPSPPDCKTRGFVFDQHGAGDAGEYISSMMDDDRKR